MNNNQLVQNRCSFIGAFFETKVQIDGRSVNRTLIHHLETSPIQNLGGNVFGGRRSNTTVERAAFVLA